MPKEPSERRRLEVLLEEIRGELRKVAEGYSLLDQKITREIQRVETNLEQRLKTVEQALMENSKDIRDLRTEVQGLQRDVRALQGEVRQLTERFETHERAHLG